jgi:hypothetical protein
MVIELVYIAKGYMEALGFQVRSGFVNDIDRLKCGKVDHLETVATFHVPDQPGAVTNQNDPINAFYGQPFIYYSRVVEKMLNTPHHPQLLYGQSIILHECVHYLQPYIHGHSKSVRYSDPKQYARQPDEHEAYLIQAIYYFNLTTVPVQLSQREKLVDYFIDYKK